MKSRRKESGFALLMVFLMAACVAIMLYIEVPRVAFEAERQRELLLVDRGNQYKRAIQVFITDRVNNPTGRYPASIDELENLNNHRHLRRRYVDPMTGKDEWRLIHINGGVLTDSVLTKPATANGSQTASAPANDFITIQAGLDGTGQAQGRGGGANRALNRRPSDPGVPGMPGSDPNMPGPGGSQGMQGYAGGVGSVPGSVPGQPGVPGVPGLPGVPGGSSAATGAPTQTCDAFIGGCAPTAPSATGAAPGLPPQPGMPVNSQGGGAAGGYSTTPGANGGAPGYGQPGFQMNPQASSAAASMIQNILTQPRPGGMPTNMPGTTLGGGIAGVASKFEAEGIMVINDRTAINEWEFIFDRTKYRPPPNPVGGAVGTPMSPMGAGGATTGTPIAPPSGAGPGTAPITPATGFGK